MTKSKKAWRFGDEELIYIKEVLNSGFGASTTGNMNQRLEHAFAGRFGVGFGITHVNGTATMHSCLAAAGVTDRKDWLPSLRFLLAACLLNPPFPSFQ